MRELLQEEQQQQRQHCPQQHARVGFDPSVWHAYNDVLKELPQQQDWPRQWQEQQQQQQLLYGSCANANHFLQPSSASPTELGPSPSAEPVLTPPHTAESASSSMMAAAAMSSYHMSPAMHAAAVSPWNAFTGRGGADRVTHVTESQTTEQTSPDESPAVSPLSLLLAQSQTPPRSSASSPSAGSPLRFQTPAAALRSQAEAQHLERLSTDFQRQRMHFNDDLAFIREVQSQQTLAAGMNPTIELQALHKRFRNWKSQFKVCQQLCSLIRRHGLHTSLCT